MNRDRIHFLFLNIGHYLDHMFTLIFATVAALALSREWGLSYGELLKYATPGFFAFGLFSLPSGWLADKWSREGMVFLFFVGIGASSIATAFAQTPLQVGIGLFFVGVFASIYHPVGLAIVTQRWKNTGMRLAVNGVWGNLGVASAALITGYFIDHGGWRAAFVAPGLVSAVVGILYAVHQWPSILNGNVAPAEKPVPGAAPSGNYKALLLRVLCDRVRYDCRLKPHLPVHDLRTAQGFRRASKGNRPRLDALDFRERASRQRRRGHHARGLHLRGVCHRFDGSTCCRQHARPIRAACRVSPRRGDPNRFFLDHARLDGRLGPRHRAWIYAGRVSARSRSTTS